VAELEGEMTRLGGGRPGQYTDPESRRALLEENALVESLQADPNACAALVVSRAQARLRGGNVIRNAAVGGHAVQVLHGGSLRQGEGFDRVEGFVELRNDALGDFRQVLIAGNSPAVEVHGGASLRIGGAGAPPGDPDAGTSIKGDVELRMGGTMTAAAAVTVNGTIYECEGRVYNTDGVGFAAGLPRAATTPPA
jgi:hypothetical protein